MWTIRISLIFFFTFQTLGTETANAEAASNTQAATDDGIGSAMTTVAMTTTSEARSFSLPHVSTQHPELSDATETLNTAESDFSTAQTVAVTDSNKNTSTVTTQTESETVGFDDLDIPYVGSVPRWINAFMIIHHFDGSYVYDGSQYGFDFVARFVSPVSSKTLVVAFYDEDGAVIEMNGTYDGVYVTFVLSKMYTSGYRFPSDTDLKMVGVLRENGEASTYSGNFTKPENSSFETFFMKKGTDKPVSNDRNLAQLAVVVAVPTSIAFIAILLTVSIVCWALKKGYLKKRDKSYRLFRNSAVTYDNERETIHI